MMTPVQIAVQLDRARSILLVGDPHATPDALKDVEALMVLVDRVARERGVPVVFLGDQYHSHAVMHVAVMDFWMNWFNALNDRGVPVAAILGNHDQPADGSGALTSMRAHEDQCLVIDGPTRFGPWLYVPFRARNEEFVEVCKEAGDVGTVVCHQAFNGSRYENGIYVQDGVDPNLIPQKMVISGHIHTPQRFGKVWHPGAPRWRIATDANVERAVHVVHFDDAGEIKGVDAYSTGDVCRQIRHAVDAPDAEFDPSGISAKDDWRVDVRGSRERCEARRKLHEAAGAKVRTFPDREHMPQIRESDGIAVAFQKFSAAYKGKRGTSAEILGKMVQERVHAAA